MSILDNKDVLTGLVHISVVLTTTKGPSAVVLSVPVFGATVCRVAGEEVFSRGTGLVEESMVVEVEEGKSVKADEGRLSATVDGASLGPGCVQTNGPAEKAAELAPRTPDVAADGEGANVSAEMVSAEDSIAVLR